MCAQGTAAKEEDLLGGRLPLGSGWGGVLVAWPFKHGLANSGTASFCQDSTGFTRGTHMSRQLQPWTSQQLTSERIASGRLASSSQGKCQSFLLLSAVPVGCSCRQGWGNHRLQRSHGLGVRVEKPAFRTVCYPYCFLGLIPPLK